MRRILYLSLALTLLLSISSCKKDGIYKPKENLSEVWYEDESTAIIVQGNDTNTFSGNTKKFLRESWEWNKKELVSRSDFQFNGQLQNKYVYEYKDKRVVGITVPGEKKTNIRFVYDNDSKRLNEIRYFTEDFTDNDLPHRLVQLIYDGKTVIGLKEIINTAKYNRLANCSVLSFLTSPTIRETIEAHQIMPKIEFTRVEKDYAFEWEGKNISKVIITSKTGGITTTETLEYTYDNKPNIRNNFAMGLIEGGVDYQILSKNNITSCNYTGENLTFSETTEYAYDKKIASEKIVTRTETQTPFPTMTIKQTITEKWSYVYVE